MGRSMRKASRGLRRLLAVAAAERATGASWEAIARAVGRRPQTCRRWPQTYAAEWERLFQAAADWLLAEAVAEARIVLCWQLQSDDVRIRRGAARALGLPREAVDPGGPAAAADRPRGRRSSVCPARGRSTQRVRKLGQDP
jgi:hypothetical protein